ncbi:MAG: EI24 domain-containing protein [Rubrivivax sp.]|jgi:hypothetical protein|nr:EI24 domain-containing protein [Rubrivivax sp.]
MGAVLDAFWRAVAYCLHPRVVLWSIAPLVLAGGAVFALGWYGWEPAVDEVRRRLEEWALVEAMFRWLDAMGLGALRLMVAPLLVVAVAVPLVVVVSLLVVATSMTPAIVDLVASRRFPRLERRQGARWWHALGWTAACTVAALLALAASLPLWLVPPLVLVLPPLIWGWLACQVLGFGVLADHASVDERRLLLHVRRWPLLAMGMCTGALGAAPSLLWATGAVTLVFAPLLVAASVWLYTLVFAFAALWFAHYALAELQRLRDAAGAAPASSPLPGPAT